MPIKIENSKNDIVGCMSLFRTKVLETSEGLDTLLMQGAAASSIVVPGDQDEVAKLTTQISEIRAEISALKARQKKKKFAHMFFGALEALSTLNPPFLLYPVAEREPYPATAKKSTSTMDEVEERVASLQDKLSVRWQIFSDSLSKKLR